MLKLVTSSEEASGPSSGTAPPKDSTSKKRKRTLRTMEDEEMYRKLRDGKPVERNTRQQNELVQLQEGMCLFVCLFVAFLKPYTHFFLFFIRSSRLRLAPKFKKLVCVFLEIVSSSHTAMVSRSTT